MSAEIIPTWDEDDSFNSIGLGPAYLPGTWTIEGLEVGIDVDTKKAKGADGPTSTDNGLDAAKFRLVGQLRWELGSGAEEIRELRTPHVPEGGAS